MPSVGKVEYLIRANDSQLDNDISNANTKVESGAKKGASAWGTVGKAAGRAFAAIGAAAVAVGTQAVKSAVSIDKAMNDIAASTGASAAELEEYEGVLKNIYANNYGESFEDIADAMSVVRQNLGALDAGAMQEVTQNAILLRDTFEYDVAESIRATSALMKNFGVDSETAMNLIATGAQNGLDYSGELLDTISEYSVQFAKVGLDAEDMFSILQEGAETGAWNLDKIGDAVKEFGIRVVDGSSSTAEGFQKIGLNADEMSAKFAAGGETAREAFFQTIEALAAMEDPLEQNLAGVDLFGTMWEDLGPEVVTQLADIADGAYSTGDALGEMAEVKYDDLGSMLEGLKRTLEMLIVPLGEQLIPVLQDMISSILPALQTALPPLIDAAGQIFAALMPVIEELLPVLSELLTPLVDIITNIFSVLGPGVSNILPGLLDVVMAILDPIMQILDLLTPLLDPLMQIVEALLPPLVEIINAFLEPLTTLVDAIMPSLIELFEALVPLIEMLSPILSAVAEIVGGVLADAFEAVAPLISGILDILTNLIDFIVNIFTGNWEDAWDNVVEIFRSLFNLIPSIAEAVINAAIALINGIIRGINKVSSAIGLGTIGEIGKVTLPRFHEGGIYNVDDPQRQGPAMLADGEMVLTQDQQAMLLDIATNGLSAQTASGLSNGPRWAAPVILEMDSREVARATAWWTSEQIAWEEM